MFPFFNQKQAFVLVSTAFSQTDDIERLEERHYETAIKPELLKKFIENVDEDTLDILTPKYVHLYTIVINLPPQLSFHI